MKLTVFSTVMILAVASANCQATASDWAPGGPDDLRGPCPMLNTLANHGFLPHDGRNITKENAVFALNTALGFNASFAELFFGHGLKSNPEANATSFTLDMLNRHNVLEHDASISRQDAFFGNNHIFNQSIFDLTKQFWTAETLTVGMLANGMLARQLNMKAFNPEYVFTIASQSVTFGEVAAPILVFGDIPSATVNKEFVVSWIENERLPTELGWVKKIEDISQEQVNAMAELVAKGSQTTTDSETAVKARRDIGFGHGFFGLARN